VPLSVPDCGTFAPQVWHFHTRKVAQSEAESGTFAVRTRLNGHFNDRFSTQKRQKFAIQFPEWQKTLAKKRGRSIARRKMEFRPFFAPKLQKKRKKGGMWKKNTTFAPSNLSHCQP